MKVTVEFFYLLIPNFSLFFYFFGLFLNKAKGNIIVQSRIVKIWNVYQIMEGVETWWLTHVLFLSACLLKLKCGTENALEKCFAEILIRGESRVLVMEAL